VVSVTPRPLFTTGKDPVPIEQEAGWTPEPVWTGAENLVPAGIRCPDRPARSQSLHRLRYPAHEFIERFSKNAQVSNFMKIHPVEVELLHMDGRTDGRTNITKLIVVFRNFANAPIKALFLAHLKTRPSKQGFMKQICSSVQAVFFLQYIL
jgi:hypothetical protein